MTYAFYVWTSYAVFIAVCLWQWLGPAFERRRIERRLVEQIEEERAARAVESAR